MTGDVPPGPRSHGAAFVEVYQNCNVFNDGAFEQITGKDARADMLIPLEHGKPIRFGADGQRGWSSTGKVARIVDVADVGEDALVVHDEHGTIRDWPSRCRVSHAGPHEPTPIGVFRAVERPDYGTGWMPSSSKRSSAKDRATCGAAPFRGDLDRRLRRAPCRRGVRPSGARRLRRLAVEPAEDHSRARLRVEVGRLGGHGAPARMRRVGDVGDGRGEQQGGVGPSRRHGRQRLGRPVLVLDLERFEPGAAAVQPRQRLLDDRRVEPLAGGRTRKAPSRVTSPIAPAAAISSSIAAAKPSPAGDPGHSACASVTSKTAARAAGKSAPGATP